MSLRFLIYVEMRLYTLWDEPEGVQAVYCLIYSDILSISDFGMMGEFKEELRDGFIEACLHLVNRDYDALAKDFVTLGYDISLFLCACFVECTFKGNFIDDM